MTCWTGTASAGSAAAPCAPNSAAKACQACLVASSRQVLQNGRITTVSSTELLPGDVVVVHPGILPCDLALVRWVQA